MDKYNELFYYYFYKKMKQKGFRKSIFYMFESNKVYVYYLCWIMVIFLTSIEDIGQLLKVNVKMTSLLKIINE